VHAVQIMDLVRVKGAEAGKLRGFGLVVGLGGTGDGSNFEPAINALAQVIRNSLYESATFEAVKDSKNVAVVALGRFGDRFLVGDAGNVGLHLDAVAALHAVQHHL